MLFLLMEVKNPDKMLKSVIWLLKQFPGKYAMPIDLQMIQPAKINILIHFKYVGINQMFARVA